MNLAALTRGQAAAEDLMSDTCQIRRRAGLSAPNPITLEVVPSYTYPYAGKCQVQLRDTVATQPDAGEKSHAVMRTVVKVPMAVAGLAVDDEVVVLTSIDGDLVGKVFRVRSVFHKTYATARRLECEEVQS